MLGDSEVLGFLRIRTFLMVVMAACVISSSAARANAAGFNFFDPAKNDALVENILFSSNLVFESDNRFTVTPANSTAIACSTGNTFTWTFTRQNPHHGGGNNATSDDGGGAGSETDPGAASDDPFSNPNQLTFTIPAGFTAPTGHISVSSIDCHASLAGINGQSVLINVPMNACHPNSSFTVTYSNVTVSCTPGVYAFVDSQGSDPTVTVVAGNGTPTPTGTSTNTPTPANTPTSTATRPRQIRHAFEYGDSDAHQYKYANKHADGSPEQHADEYCDGCEHSDKHTDVYADAIEDEYGDPELDVDIHADEYGDGCGDAYVHIDCGCNADVDEYVHADADEYCPRLRQLRRSPRPPRLRRHPLRPRLQRPTATNTYTPTATNTSTPTNTPTAAATSTFTPTPSRRQRYAEPDKYRDAYAYSGCFDADKHRDCDSKSVAIAGRSYSHAWKRLRGCRSSRDGADHGERYDRAERHFVDLAVTYNPAVVMPATPAYDTTGTLSSTCSSPQTRLIPAILSSRHSRRTRSREAAH